METSGFEPGSLIVVQIQNNIGFGVGGTNPPAGCLRGRKPTTKKLLVQRRGKLECVGKRDGQSKRERGEERGREEKRAIKMRGKSSRPSGSFRVNKYHENYV